MGFIINNGILKKYVSDSNRVKIVIPEGVTAIKPRAFENCYRIESIFIPSTVTSIGAGAFRNCERLQDINIPETVKTIGHYAFLNCMSLHQIAIPTNTVKIESGAFEGCFMLWDLTVPDMSVYSSLGLSSVTTLIFSEKVEQFTNSDISILENSRTLQKIRFLDGREITLNGGRATMILPNTNTFTINMEYFKDSDGKYFESPDMIRSALLTGEYIPIWVGGRLQTVAGYFFASGDERAKAFIKSNFTKLVRTLIDEKNLEYIQKLAEYGGFFNKRNIDKLIDYAIASAQNGGSLEIQLYLMDFKANNIGFADTDKKLKL